MALFFQSFPPSVPSPTDRRMLRHCFAQRHWGPPVLIPMLLRLILKWLQVGLNSKNENNEIMKNKKQTMPGSNQKNSLVGFPRVSEVVDQVAERLLLLLVYRFSGSIAFLLMEQVFWVRKKYFFCARDCLAPTNQTDYLLLACELSQDFATKKISYQDQVGPQNRLANVWNTCFLLTCTWFCIKVACGNDLADYQDWWKKICSSKTQGLQCFGG